eukprot:TRINITY_DN47441_c0_g1_i1.p1 TRINITY_DN47441_c0_g1~~TRINITY_DN47441_c0_g1_i1.p1  ORF type:complete len:315 (+),score=4.50 TRINITY_DN47441_c0_g1_i1:37-981(+)
MSGGDLEGVWSCGVIEGWQGGDVWLDVRSDGWVGIGCSGGRIPMVKGVKAAAGRGGIIRVEVVSNTGEPQKWVIRYHTNSKWRHQWHVSATISGASYSLTRSHHPYGLVWSIYTAFQAASHHTLPYGEWEVQSPLFSSIHSSPGQLKVSCNGAWALIPDYRIGPYFITFSFKDTTCRASIHGSAGYIDGTSQSGGHWLSLMSIVPGVRFQKPAPLAAPPPAQFVRQSPRHYLLKSLGGILTMKKDKNSMTHILGKPKEKKLPVSVLSPAEKKKQLLEQGFTIPGCRVAIPELIQYHPTAKQGQPYKRAPRRCKA